MTRRRFIERLLAVVGVVAAGLFRLKEKAVPRRFVRARPMRQYPGPVGKLNEMEYESRWSG